MEAHPLPRDHLIIGFDADGGGVVAGGVAGGADFDAEQDVTPL